MLKRFSISREEILPKYGMPLDAATQRDLGAAIYSIVFGMAYFIITGYPGASPLFTSFLKDYLGVSDSAYGLILTLPFITVLLQVPFTIYVARRGRIKQSFSGGWCPGQGHLSDPRLPAHPGESAQQPGRIPDCRGDDSPDLHLQLDRRFGDQHLVWFPDPDRDQGPLFLTRQMIFTIAMLFYALTMSQLLQLLRDWRWKYTLFFSLASCLD
jgi:hypothetical protein